MSKIPFILKSIRACSALWNRVSVRPVLFQLLSQDEDVTNSNRTFVHTTKTVRKNVALLERHCSFVCEMQYLIVIVCVASFWRKRLLTVVVVILHFAGEATVSVRWFDIFYVHRFSSVYVDFGGASKLCQHFFFGTTFWYYILII